jgi:hypothetical protein
LELANVEATVFRALRDLLLIGFALASILAASQIPGFIQESEQRLGGARDEMTRLVVEFTSIAERADTDLAGYAIHLVDNADASISATGREILSLLERENAMAAHADALAASSRLVKPLVVIGYADREIVGATWKVYRYTLTLDPEFGLMGLGVGWLLYAFISAILGAMIPRRSYRIRAEKPLRSGS